MLRRFGFVFILAIFFPMSQVQAQTSTLNGSLPENAVPLIKPNEFCKPTPNGEGFVCNFVTPKVDQIQRVSRIAFEDNPGGELMILTAGENKIQIMAPSGYNSTLESCERLALKGVNGATQSPIYFGVEVRYLKNTANLSDRITRPKQLDIMLDPSQGAATWVQCYVMPAPHFSQ